MAYQTLGLDSLTRKQVLPASPAPGRLSRCLVTCFANEETEVQTRGRYSAGKRWSQELAQVQGHAGIGLGRGR